MIEKLKTINPYDETEIDMDINSVAGLVYENTPLVQKINELVDAVNSLRDDCNLLMGYIAPEDKCEPTISKIEKVETPAENVQDPCAEAQKWVGCICRFWYDNSNDTCLDYLDKVQIGKDGLEYCGKETYDWYPYCEPVLPTDKAIYKGGKDE